MFLHSTGVFVTIDEVVLDACLTRTVVDDLVWRFLLADWESRRPASDRAEALASWLDEFTALGEERDRVSAVARFYGIET